VVKFPHDLNLVNEGLLSFLLAESALFGKSLNSIFFIVLMFDHQVNRGEIPLSYLFNRFEKLMKSSLVDFGL
jgi:hypothetical protein